MTKHECETFSSSYYSFYSVEHSKHSVYAQNNSDVCRFRFSFCRRGKYVSALEFINIALWHYMIAMPLLLLGESYDKLMDSVKPQITLKSVE